MITPTAPIAQPAILSYDLKSVGIDMVATPHIVNIVYFGEMGAAQVTPDLVITMTLAAFEATPGATLKLKLLQAVANSLGLVSPTIA